MQLYKSRRRRVCDPQLVCGMESTRSVVWNRDEGAYVINPKENTPAVMPYTMRVITYA